MPVIELGRRERKKQAARERICEETLMLVASHGIEGTTIDAICDCADIAKKTFYNYYASKHDLMLDICQSLLMERMESTISDALAVDRDLGAQLDHIFNEIAERTQGAGTLEKGLIEFMVGNLAANPAEGAGQLSMMNAYYLRLYEHYKDALRPELSPEFCAEMTVGMSNAVTLNWLHHKKYDAGTRYRQLSNYLKESMLKTS